MEVHQRAIAQLLCLDACQWFLQIRSGENNAPRNMSCEKESTRGNIVYYSRWCTRSKNNTDGA